MNPSQALGYQRWCWRSTGLSGFWLNDGSQGPGEWLLQRLWAQQALPRDRLRLEDGRVLTVVHPGFLNRGRGPDFFRALIQIDGGPFLEGDVEIDLIPAGWHQHGHDRNPDFGDVMLHVVWVERAARTGAVNLPRLALRPVLPDWRQIADSLTGDDLLPERFQGRCAGPLATVDSDTMSQVLESAAWTRLRRKAEALRHRARQADPIRALWEGLFEGLGYKENSWPMRRLGELIRQIGILKADGRPAFPGPEGVEEVQRRLFAVSGLDGLCPSEGREPVGTPGSGPPGTDRTRYAGLPPIPGSCFGRIRPLPLTAWRLGSARPSNHPLRRLALVARWLVDLGFHQGLEEWFWDAPEERAPAQLLGLLLPDLETLGAGDGRIDSVSYWESHWSPGRPIAGQSNVALLGPHRATDLAVNVILPWFWGREDPPGPEAWQRRAESMYFAWPASDDNALLRLARKRLLARRTDVGLGSAAEQQGMLQVLRDFCDRSNAICEACPFPEYVRSRGSTRP